MPLKVLSREETGDRNVNSLVIGELSVVEKESFDKVQKTVLGVGYDKQAMDTLLDLTVPNQAARSETKNLSRLLDLSGKVTDDQVVTPDQTTSSILTMPKDEGIEHSTDDKESAEHIAAKADASELRTDRLKCDKAVKIVLKKCTFNNLRQRTQIPQKLMDAIPNSKYIIGWDKYIPDEEGNASDSTVLYSPPAQQVDLEAENYS